MEKWHTYYIICMVFLLFSMSSICIFNDVYVAAHAQGMYYYLGMFQGFTLTLSAIFLGLLINIYIKARKNESKS